MIVAIINIVVIVITAFSISKSNLWIDYFCEKKSDSALMQKYLLWYWAAAYILVPLFEIITACQSVFFFLFSSKMPPSYLLLLLFYHWECEAETVFSSSLILCNTCDKQIKLTSSGDSVLNWTNKTKTSLKGYCVTLVYNFNFPVKIISRKYWIF